MKNEPLIKNWSEATITDRFMFNRIFTSNPEACKRLLEILLGFKISRIEKPQGEYSIEVNEQTHGVRFDVYTEDDNNLYDIELQTTSETDLPERSRFYQSMMDVDSLMAGKPYSELKTSIVIFICTFDPFGKKRPKYEFKNIDVFDKTTELNDRSVKIFFNVNEYDKITNDEELKGLLKFFSSNQADTGFTNSLAEFVFVARHNEMWRQNYMTIEQYNYYTKKEGIAQGIQLGLKQGISQGIQQGIARQKAEDEKIIARVTTQKDAEIARLLAEVEKLKANQSSRI